MLRLKLELDGVGLDVDINGAGDPFDIEPLEFDADLAPQDIPAYGRPLLGVLEGHPTLSIHADEAEESWRIVEPVLEAWRVDMVPLLEYAAGSKGPSVDEGPATRQRERAGTARS